MQLYSNKRAFLLLFLSIPFEYEASKFFRLICEDGYFATDVNQIVYIY